MRLFRLPSFPLTWQQSAGRLTPAPNPQRALSGYISAKWLGLTLLAAISGTGTSLHLQAQPGIDAFHWVDFHDAKDAPTVAWVTQSLKAEKWTSIREIGVQWDSALVVTSERKTPQSAPPSDIYTVWSVALSKKAVQPLLHGANPHILNWTTFGGEFQRAPELAIVYDDCYGCDAPSTFFTTLYYNFNEHAWRARWMRGDQAAALWGSGTIDGVIRTQVYGLLTEPPGRDVLATWIHNDYGKAKPAEDFVFEYSVDPISALEQTQGLSGIHAEEMELRLCRANPGQADPSLAELARGQDSDLCKQLIAAKVKSAPTRRPATTPPANNHGKSAPPGVKK
jgi:hypothetical protein